MIKIEGEFLTLTSKVRTNGKSFIVGLTKDECKVAGIEKGTVVQIFMRKYEEVVENTAPQSSIVSNETY